MEVQLFLLFIGQSNGTDIVILDDCSIFQKKRTDAGRFRTQKFD